MDAIIFLIGLPLVSGILCILLPRIKEAITVFTSFIILVVSIAFFVYKGGLCWVPEYFSGDSLSRFILLFIAIFSFIIALYSIRFMRDLAKRQQISINQYYCYFLWTLSASIGVALANNLIILLVFWGFLGMTLYLLIQVGLPERTTIDSENDPSSSAKKTFIIVGGSDCFMILGIAIVWFISGSFQMDRIAINIMGEPYHTLRIIGYLCLAVAAFAKAGVMPFHTWIPDVAVSSPIPVTAYLPASLDKLLGIYLLTRISTDLFDISSSPGIIMFLLITGAITIVAAVFMAMIQHDIKKLLSYHAISQVGYMVMGIGTGIPVGVAGGLFHMLNHAIYKSCLFLCSGSVENKTETTDIEQLGGLSKYMPLTFLACLVSALAISGVPPINGFVSKWMIYQGLLAGISKTDATLKIILIISLICAMFGSALTLASFMKLLHGVFLGQASKPKEVTNITEVNWIMWVPQIILSLSCIVFGIFAFSGPLSMFIYPALNYPLSIDIIGLWEPGNATFLILAGIVLGVLIYTISKIKYRIADTYIGGEKLSDEERISGADFYLTVKDMNVFKSLYYFAQVKVFDIYHWGKNIVFTAGSILSVIHTGNLHSYISWCLFGLAIILILFLK